MEWKIESETEKRETEIGKEEFEKVIRLRRERQWGEMEQGKVWKGEEIKE